MPYVTEATRKRLIKYRLPEPSTVGELNFIISTLCDEYIARYKLNYQNLNELIGVLECVKLELYRRVAAIHEDNTLAKNGEVYGNAMKALYPEPPTPAQLFPDAKQESFDPNQQQVLKYGETKFG